MDKDSGHTSSLAGNLKTLLLHDQFKDPRELHVKTLNPLSNCYLPPTPCLLLSTIAVRVRKAGA